MLAYRPFALPLLLAALTACNSATDSAAPRPGTPTPTGGDWLKENTVALRNHVPMPNAAARLSAAALATQLGTYDPGSLLRCEVLDDPAYRAAIDTLGGVGWGYGVSFLEDQSKPQFLRGPVLPYPALDSAGGAAPVEIEKADVVGLSESAALYYSPAHGLLLVDLTAAEPSFKCAAKLPGQVKDFYYYQGELVVMVGDHLLHFKVEGARLAFVELIKLDGPVLDTRRFNDRLVVYSSLSTGDTASTTADTGSGTGGGVGAIEPGYYRPQNPHRALRVFKFGATLSEELHESLRDTSPDDGYLNSGAIAEGTAPGTVVHTGTTFGDALYASDHYFVVSEAVVTTKLSGFITNSYNYCTASHEQQYTQQICNTLYKTVPNPQYTPPDNSGGDRACKGTTLSDCLRAVARVSNPTMQVPNGVVCKDQTFSSWTCDHYETRTYTYPTFTTSTDTQLNIFEYSEAGFVRLDSKVHAVTTPGLEQLALADKVPTLTTSDEAYELSVPGRLQTLQFQNGFLYAIADGVLQVYTMGDSSLVRTSSLSVVGNSLQSSLFSPDKLYLSDYRYDLYDHGDHSTLRVFDLSNPAYPRQASEDRELVGGHNNILALTQGILTVGSVNNFGGTFGSQLKLGLFADPFTTEKAYLILGADLANAYLGQSEAQYFDVAQSRLFLPYTGLDREDEALNRARIGVSHVLDDEIVSEGAVHLPEPIQRVRPRPGPSGQLLSFGPSSIHQLTSADGSWHASPLLEYYTPVALYRRNENDDYVEVSQLGSSCKLRFAHASELNKRVATEDSDAFDCRDGWSIWAYENNILFGSKSGVSFDEDGVLSPLSAEQIASLEAKRQRRKVCLYSTQPSNQPLDFADLPPADDLRCYTPDEYRALQVATPASFSSTLRQ